MRSAGANPVRSRIPRDNAGERYLKRNRDLFNQARDRKETANAERCTRGNTQVGANLVRLESFVIGLDGFGGRGRALRLGKPGLGCWFAKNQRKGFKRAYAPRYGVSDDDSVESDSGVVVCVRTPNDVFLGLGRP